MLVTAVGVNSTWGKTMALVSEAGDDETPLQQKLEVLAAAIGKIGLGVAVCCFIAQLIKWVPEGGAERQGRRGQGGRVLVAAWTWAWDRCG